MLHEYEVLYNYGACLQLQRTYLWSRKAFYKSYWVLWPHRHYHEFSFERFSSYEFWEVMVYIGWQSKSIQSINNNFRWAQSSKCACVIYLYLSLLTQYLYIGPQNILVRHYNSNILISIKLVIWFPRWLPFLLLCLQNKSWCYKNM